VKINSNAVDCPDLAVNADQTGLGKLDVPEKICGSRRFASFSHRLEMKASWAFFRLAIRVGYRFSFSGAMPPLCAPTRGLLWGTGFRCRSFPFALWLIIYDILPARFPEVFARV